MTTEQLQKLSQLTDEAVEINDLESLGKIFDMLTQEDSEESKEPNYLEWFYNAVGPDTMEWIRSRR